MRPLPLISIFIIVNMAEHHQPKQMPDQTDKLVRINARGQVRPSIYNCYSHPPVDCQPLSVHMERKEPEEVGLVEQTNEISTHSDHSNKADRSTDVDISRHILNKEQSSQRSCSQMISEAEHIEPETDMDSSPHGDDLPMPDMVDVIDCRADYDMNCAIENNNDDSQCSGHRSATLKDATMREDGGNDPIYQGHTMSVHTSLTLIWVYAMVHSITGVQLADLLTLVSLHCLYSNPFLDSLKRFRKYFADMKTPLVKHYFCAHCLSQVSSDVKVCPNSFCSKDILKVGGKSYYIEFPIVEQLKNFFTQEHFVTSIQKRFTRQKKGENCIEDIYDGAVYKQLSMSGGPLSRKYPYNISMTWNTDGIPLFKSSKMSIWPVYLMINELPWKMRKKKENMLFYGLWFGDVKPLMSVFMEPLHSSLENLERNGLDVNIHGEETNIKGFLICGTADLPARSIVLNMNQFNGSFSCIRCTQRGETCKVGLRGHTHVFPYCPDNPSGPPRTREEVVDHAFQASQSSKTTMGIKGPSFLMMLDSYNYVKSTSIDYMHGVVLGVTKRLMCLWFTSDGTGKEFSLTKFVALIDERLKNIKPPHLITRRPRSIADHLKYWKASELRSWLWYYSLPVLKDVMKPIYFNHYAALVEAVWALSKDSISQHELENSSKLLNYFVAKVAILYGNKYCTLNIHQLVHLPECVRDLGPLWVYSCFHFESVNGDLLKLFHGTQNVQTQIVGAVNMHQMLPSLITKIPFKYQNVSFVKKLVTKRSVSLGLQIEHDVYCLGNLDKSMLPDDQLHVVYNRTGVSSSEFISVYKRIMLRSEVYHSQSYTRVKGRNSYTVKYLSEKEPSVLYGHVKCYIVQREKVCHCQVKCTCAKMVLAVIAKLLPVSEGETLISGPENTTGLSLTAGHIITCSASNILDVVDVHRILAVCVTVTLGSKIYVCEMPNTQESD